MIQAILQIPDYESKTDAEILAILAAETREVRDETPVTVGDIAAELGEDIARLVSATLFAAGEQDSLVKMTVNGISTNGIRLDPPTRQAMIDDLAVAGEWPDAVRDAVKAMRVRDEPVWPGITVDDVRATRISHYAERLIQRVSAAINLAALQADATEQTVRDAVTAEII